MHKDSRDQWVCLESQVPLDHSERSVTEDQKGTWDLVVSVVVVDLRDERVPREEMEREAIGGSVETLVFL